MNNQKSLQILRQEVVFNKVASKLINSENLLKEKDFIQHGTTSCYLHSLAVAYYSFNLARRLGIKCRFRSLVRGAILHDYFLYDWHEKSDLHRLHGFSHPYKAFENASEEYLLNDIEKDIILRHMFPLTLIPPKHVESFIVCIVDKICSLSETFRVCKYKEIEQLLRASYENKK